MLKRLAGGVLDAGLCLSEEELGNRKPAPWEGKMWFPISETCTLIYKT